MRANLRYTVGSLMVLIGWVLTFVGLSMTKTVRDSYYSAAISWVVLYFGAFLLAVQLLALMYVREFRAAYFAVEQGTAFQAIGLTLILYGSRLPLMFHGHDESWFVFMVGLPMWVFGLDWRFNLGTSWAIFFFVLSGMLPIAAPRLWSECQITRILAFYFVFIQTAIYSIAYVTLKDKRSRTGIFVCARILPDEDLQLRHQERTEEQSVCAN